MLTRRFLNIYGIVGIVLMTTALLLIWMNIIPSTYYVPLFMAAFVLWASRLIMRFMLARKEQREEDEKASGPTHNP